MFASPQRRLECFFLTLVLLLSPQPLVRGQSILDEKLQVAKGLQPLDNAIREQLITLFNKRDAAEASHGRESAEWFEADDQNNPLAVCGATLLQYAREHPGTTESLACLSYIIDWGEGGQAALCRSACEELITHEKDNPAVSWLCSRCTNSLYLDSMEGFLTKLSETSSNPTVKAAAAYNLAALCDNAVETHRNLTTLRKRFNEAGIIKAQPVVGLNLNSLERRSTSELSARRNMLLKLVVARYPNARSWRADHVFGRLNYQFAEDPKQPTYRELANRLSYEIDNLRAGCIAPDFEATKIDGRSFSLSERRGQSILLMFSFKGCGACESMYPALRTVQKRFAPDGFSIFGVMVDETVDTVREAVETGAITWPCVWDGRSGPIIKTYNVQYYPTVLLIDAEGRIVSTNLRSEEELVTNIERLIKRQPEQ